MELSETISNTIETIKNNNLDLEKDKNISILKNDLVNVTQNAVDKAANYVIKAMPIPDAARDILKDVKDSLKTRDLKTVLTTAVNSSIREGLELLGLSKSGINSLIKMKDVAVKGGFINNLKNGIEITANNFLKNNIVGDYVYKFFDELKQYVQSNRFMEKLNSIINKIMKKKDEFLNKCNKWYDAYKNMDLKSMNQISLELDKNKYVISRYEECKRENHIIQNMTDMINNKKGFLSDAQQKLCQVI